MFQPSRLPAQHWNGGLLTVPPQDAAAPKRPASAYLFFLSECRANWKVGGCHAWSDVLHTRLAGRQLLRWGVRRWCATHPALLAPPRPAAPHLQAQHPGAKLHQRTLCAAAGQEWARMGAEERAHFVELSNRRKADWAAYMQRRERPSGQRRQRRGQQVSPCWGDQLGGAA